MTAVFDFYSAGVNSAHFYTPELPRTASQGPPYPAVFSSTHLPSLQGLRIPLTCSPAVLENLWSSTDIPRTTREGTNCSAFPWSCALTRIPGSSAQGEEGSTRWQQHSANAPVWKRARGALCALMFLRGPLAAVTCVLPAHSIAPCLSLPWCPHLHIPGDGREAASRGNI